MFVVDSLVGTVNANLKAVVTVVLVVGALVLRSRKEKRLSLKHIPGPEAKSYVLGESSYGCCADVVVNVRGC